MSGGSYARYPYQTISEIGASLTSVTSGLSEHDRAAYDINGLSSDQSRIDSAIDGFRSEWKASVSKLTSSIGSLGQLSNEIGHSACQLDQGVAKGIKGKG